MVSPSVAIKDGMGGRWFARSFSRSAATERLVNAIFVVIDSELFQLSLQVDCVPDEHVIKGGIGRRRFARSLSWCAATERLVNAIFVVIISELFQLSIQVDCVPDQHVIKELPSYRPDQPFHKRMGHRDVRDRLDLFDLENA